MGGRKFISDHQFELQTHEVESALAVSVAGRVDGLSAEDFHARLEQIVKTYEGDAVILDFETLSYINSAGLRAILLVAKILHSKGKKFALCSLSDAIYSMVKTTGFDKVIDICESRSEAIAAITN